MHDIEHRIGGKAVSSDRSADVFNPALGVVTGRVALASQEVVDDAVAAAAGAFEQWRTTSVSARQRIMFALRDVLVRSSDDLARLITAEHGKTHDDARGEVGRGIEVVEYACGIPQLLKGEHSPNVATDVTIQSLRQPLGVCAGITPFNFPVMVPLWMAPMAIATGNTFVLKPSERDPSPSVLLAELFAEAGVPDGVFNVVHGDKVAVDALLAHPGVAAVSFVGSTPVARHVYETAAANGKRVQALGGAKNHLVVMPDADMDAVADALVSAAYGSAGERCMAVSVAVAVGDAADRFVPLVAQRLAALRVGDGADAQTDMGPLITREHRDRVRGYVDGGVAGGATPVVDGRDKPTPTDGFFLGPTLFDHVTTDMDIYRDEIFGPVLSVLRVDSLDAALQVVNTNPYGNGAAIFTDSGAAAHHFSAEVTAGMVGVNVPIPVPLSFYSFGGWKGSLFGDRPIYGPEAIGFYTRAKVVTSRWRPTEQIRPDMGFSSGT
jgi:malonate-semialdehyde dehydrogenase (acetylating)/methylmalonate-semialdehyde dehydrogenase